jgi:hypothetical protein
VVRGDRIKIDVNLAWPVRNSLDWESDVNLYVPPKWKKRQEFIARLKAPKGFEHVNQHTDDDLAEETCAWKDLKYESHVLAEGFDSSSFVGAFRDATRTLVAMEKGIDRILERLGVRPTGRGLTEGSGSNRAAVTLNDGTRPKPH